VSPVELTDGRGGGKGMGEEPYHTTVRKPGLYNLFIALCYPPLFEFVDLERKKEFYLSSSRDIH
jgi:hypothetical protein